MERDTNPPPTAPLEEELLHSVAPNNEENESDHAHQHEQQQQQHRRRLQNRQHQRRRRARLQARTQSLEHDVLTLTHEIETLRSENVYLFASRGTDSGAPARLVTTFYQVYKHGNLTSRQPMQDAFLYSFMARGVRGVDFHGVDAVAQQLRLYESLFVHATYIPWRLRVFTLDETTLVVADVVMTMLPNRRGVACLCPSMGGDEWMVQHLLANALTFCGCVQFLFDASGRVAWLDADLDFVSGVFTVLGVSLERVNEYMAHSQISLSSGYITVTAQPPAPEPVADVQRDGDPPPLSRYDIAYILS